MWGAVNRGHSEDVLLIHLSCASIAKSEKNHDRQRVIMGGKKKQISIRNT